MWVVVVMMMMLENIHDPITNGACLVIYCPPYPPSPQERARCCGLIRVIDLKET